MVEVTAIDKNGSLLTAIANNPGTPLGGSTVSALPDAYCLAEGCHASNILFIITPIFSTFWSIAAILTCLPIEAFQSHIKTAGPILILISSSARRKSTIPGEYKKITSHWDEKMVALSLKVLEGEVELLEEELREPNSPGAIAAHWAR